MSAQVLALHQSAGHAFSKQPVASVRLIAGLDVEGDAHNGVTVEHRSPSLAIRPSPVCVRCIQSTQSSWLSWLHRASLDRRAASAKKSRLGASICSPCRRDQNCIWGESFRLAAQTAQGCRDRPEPWGWRQGGARLAYYYRIQSQ
jgi:hypothetical protein